ncbi:MAG TPA: HAMP domain-containing sensor histidine kinase [Bacteroidia bacterium]|nr:HAMP domain-containing sensor histidine kinase [Bacteroidia bacterium]
MKIHRIRIIIILILIALLGLISVQIFWATQSFELSKKTFESNVRDAMKKTVNEYVRSVICFELFSKIRISAQQGVYMLRQSWANKKFVSSDSLLPDTVPMYFAGANQEIPFDYNQLYFTRPVDMEVVFRFEYLDAKDSMTVPYADLKSGNINMHNYREQFSADKHIEENFIPDIIDSMLKINLRDYLIFDSFHFGYVRRDSVLVGYSSPSAKQSKLIDSSLRTSLGDSKYFTQEYDLSLYFDDQDGLILAGLRSTLFLSALVVLILTASFYYSVRLILRQRKLSELKNDFINNMTHEFKTPLANISIALETIAARPDMSSGRDRTIEIIGQETERLYENVEKILQVARFEQGAIQLSLEKLNINHVVKKAVSYFEARTHSNELDIKCILNAKPDTVLADETHLINVLCNLIDNAIKYNERKPQIIIRTESSARGVSIYVEDNGIGMKADTQKRVFEKFFRESTGDLHSVEGFGLGLSYVKSIVDSHKGKVEVSSQPGKGSRFLIFIPYHI